MLSAESALLSLLCSRRTGKQPLPCGRATPRPPGLRACPRASLLWRISLDALAKRSLSINRETAAHADASCASISVPSSSLMPGGRGLRGLPPFAPVAGIPGPPTHHSCLWQGPSAISFPLRSRHSFWKKPQIFNFFPRLAQPGPRHLSFANTVQNVGTGPLNCQAKCRRGRPLPNTPQSASGAGSQGALNLAHWHP